MKLFFTLLFAINLLIAQGQTMGLNWSDRQVYENKKDGFFDNFIGGNSKYVYAKFNQYAWNYRKKNSKIKLVAYDKNTMKQVASLPIIGYNQNGYDQLTYFDQVVFEKSIIIFFTKKANKKTELYAQAFDENLVFKTNLKKIIEINNEELKNNQNILIGGNENAGQQILIGTEPDRERGENVQFNYIILNNDLTFDSTQHINLPYPSSVNFSANYTLQNDGMLYIYTNIKISKDGRKVLYKHELFDYKLLTIVNLTTHTQHSYALKFEDKNLFTINYTVVGNTVKLYGLYCDLLKDEQGVDLHGIFYAEIDNITNQMHTPIFTIFDKFTLDQLFAKDQEDKQKNTIFNTSKAKKSNAESLNNDFVIENIQTIDSANVVLFTTRMQNYAVQRCNGRGYCTTSYYCKKSNITVFKINNAGKLIWASNLDREITYPNWNIQDISVMNKENKMYVVYGSSYNLIPSNNKMYTRKKVKKDANNIVEYGVFDYATGAYKKYDFRVNTANTKRRDVKTLSATSITQINNGLYVSSSKIRMKIAPLVFAIATCFTPLVLIPILVGNTRIGNGYLGTIAPFN
ncbi:MAG: hypothetical protein H7331_07440 [Bacteroidia bacterium]|nr:hypothetical protein [Bacteroidia bacterium]